MAEDHPRSANVPADTHPAATPVKASDDGASAPPSGSHHSSTTDRLANLARLWRAGNAAKRGAHVAQAVKAGSLLIKGKVLFWIALAVGVLVALFVATMAIAAFLGGMPTATQCASASAAAQAPSGGAVVGASEYGGPGDPSTPSDHSASGVALTGHMAFAELGLPPNDSNPNDASNLGSSLGYGKALPFHSTVRITANGRSVVAEKLDVGGGGPPVGSPSHSRDIDLWWQTAQALGLDTTGSGQWSGLVTVQIVHLPATPLTSSTEEASSNTAGNCSTKAVATASGSTIVQIAQSQLNVYDGGNYCSPYSHGSCRFWCSDFVSWVWQHAGIQIPDYPFSGDIYTWGQHNTQVLSPTATPAPGDAIEFGTGPQDASTSFHVGIVEQVFPNGEITVINGDYNHHVERSGPFQPAQAAAGSGSGHPIYAYVVP